MKHDEKLERLAAEAAARAEAGAAKVAKRQKVRAFKEEYHDRMREETAAQKAKKAG